MKNMFDELLRRMQNLKYHLFAIVEEISDTSSLADINELRIRIANMLIKASESIYAVEKMRQRIYEFQKEMDEKQWGVK